jgi:hypothetical protein
LMAKIARSDSLSALVETLPWKVDAIAAGDALTCP